MEFNKQKISADPDNYCDSKFLHSDYTNSKLEYEGNDCEETGAMTLYHHLTAIDSAPTAFFYSLSFDKATVPN